MYGLKPVPFNQPEPVSRLKAGSRLSPRFQFAETCQQFGVEDGGSGGAANGVVREHGGLPVEHAAGAQAAHGHRHAVAAIAVQSGLGAIVLGSPLDGLIGSGGQLLAGEGTELVPSGEQFFPGGRTGQFDRDALGVAVLDGDAVATGADAGGEGGDGVAFKTAEKLEGFGLHLFFFAANVGHDVDQDVHGGYAGVAGAGDGLHGGHEDLFDAEALLDGLEGHDQAYGGAVGVGDHVAARLAARGLLLDQVEVLGVNLGNDQGHVGRHAVGAGVGNDGAAGLGKAGFEVAGDGGVQSGENYFGCGLVSGGRSQGVGGSDGHAGDASGERRVQAPPGGFSVGFAAGAVAGAQPCNFKPGMALKQLNEALADHSGRAEDADGIFVLDGHKHSSVQEDGLGLSDSCAGARGLRRQNRDAASSKPRRIRSA